MQTPLVQFDALRFAFGEDEIFEFGSAAIQPGEIVVMVGPSGAGKSTLMRLLRGELEPISGSVSINGTPVETRKKRLVLDEKQAGWVPQLDDLQRMLSIEENIGHHILRLDEEERVARVEKLMQSMNLTPFAGQITHTLSGGQRQRVSIAKAMAGNPPVLLMDESLAQLDLRTKSAILLDIKAMIKRSQSAALLVLHDPADALLVADTLWVIRGGKLVQSGTPNAIIAHPAHHEIAGLFDYINVVPADLNIPGPWREENGVKWLYAHDLPTLDAEVLDRMETPSGSIIVYQYQNHRLLKK
ncbi:MAG: ATP-binding cassette domain-containing protein [Bacteroidetes bacterium]|nr:ATP-binding cassette domain-containing protein [Bacteroidota bacterium]